MEKLKQISSFLALLLAFVALVLVATGRVQEVKIGPEGIDIKGAIQHALSQPAVHAVKADVPIEKVISAGRGPMRAAKETEQRAEVLIQDRVQALVFHMGKGHTGAAVQVYINRLLPQPFFRYVVIDDEDGNFFGLIPAQSILETVSLEQPSQDPENSFASKFSEWLNTSDKAELRRIPGFSNTAIDAGTDKQQALKLLDEKDAQFLPVVQNGKFTGVADRSRIIASILLDISSQLSPSDSKAGKNSTPGPK
jgi:hypothetical protein